MRANFAISEHIKQQHDQAINYAGRLVVYHLRPRRPHGPCVHPGQAMNPVADKAVTQLSDDQIVRIITRAFAPLQCIVEIRLGKLVRFKVGQSPRWCFVEMGYPLPALRDEKTLRSMLMAAREEVEKKGHDLRPWSLMSDPLLSRIPGDLLGEAVRLLPTTQPTGPALQSVILRLPDRQRVRVTFVRIMSRRGRTARWFWTAEHAELLSND